MLKTPFRVLSHCVITALFLTQSTQPPTEAQEGSSAFAWNIRYLKDPMHDTTHLRATLSQPSETAPGATTVGTASCDDDGLNLDIGHFAATGDDPGFKINYPPQGSQAQTGFVGIGLAGMVAATIAAAAMSGQRDTSAWVNYSLKIDDRFLDRQSAKPLYTNVIRLRFKRDDMDPIVNAKRIVMEIPEPDDTPVYFEFHPDDPSFQMVAAACGARVPLTPVIIAAGYANRALTDKEISEALSSVLSESARSHNLPPNFYSDEITRIVQIVNVCNMVNDAMLTAATSDKTVDLTRLGRGFAECEPSTPINISREVQKSPATSPPKPTDIYFSGNVMRTYLNSRLSAGLGGGWGGFMMSVFIGGADHPVFKNVCAKFMPNFVSSSLPKMWIFQGQRGLSNGNNPLGFGQYIVGPTWIPLSAKVLLSYRVEGTKNATAKVELLRADDNNGHPGEWSIIATDSKTMGGDGWNDVDFDDVPSRPGRYWYGTHIIESTGKEAREPSSVRVTVASQEDLAATSPLSPESLFPGGADLVLDSPAPISPAPSVPVLAPPAPAPSVPASPVSIAPDQRTIQLTSSSASALRIVTIKAPGMRKTEYNLFTIDTRNFNNGGTLIVDIEIQPDSATDGSFDLYAADVSNPTTHRPVAGRYDIRKGTNTRIEYKFRTGQLFLLDLQGNWFSPKGSTGVVKFQAQVRP